MTTVTDDELYARGIATLVASWEAYARGSAGAVVTRLRGVTAAVFPAEPERGLYNNAVLDRGLGPAERIAAIDAMAAAYGRAGIHRYAAWVHESDDGMRADLGRRGYTVDEVTRAMGMPLAGVSPASPAIDAEPVRWHAYLELLWSAGAPAGVLAGTDPHAFRALMARRDGEPVTAAVAFDHDGDCGLFNMATLAPARRRGTATALTAHHVRAAAVRGCSTASLQATPMAERLYAAVGFRDLGRILEHVP